MMMDAVRIIRSLLPPGWEVAASSQEGKIANIVYDASMVIKAPDGKTETFLTELKAGRLAGADQVMWQLHRIGLETNREVLLIAQYLGPTLREQCEKRGINYVDLTGWCWLKASEPALAIRAVGAAKDPRPPRASTITRLSGAGAGRIIRALLDGRFPLGIRAFAEQAGLSAGTVSKVFKELDSEGVVTRDDSGHVTAVKKRLLIERWIRDYSFLKTNNVGWYLAPRGIEHLMKRALDSDAQVVETGLSAAQRLLPRGVLPVVATSQIALYVPSVTGIAEDLSLVLTDRPAANILLAEPYDAQLLRQPASPTDLRIADLGQVIADLKTMPGRASQAGDHLMESLAVTNKDWE